jgi:hypothetical protein
VTAASCEDGSEPVQVEPEVFECGDGSEPGCDDGSELTISSDGSKLVCTAVTGAGDGSVETECFSSTTPGEDGEDPSPAEDAPAACTAPEAPETESETED